MILKAEMEHYVTYFDSFFLPQGLALYRSMENYAGEFTLWILCMDEETSNVLNRLSLKNSRLLNLLDYENEELIRIKPDRTLVEYYWTLTPFVPKFVFDTDESVKRVTYIDADLWFRKSPAPIFREFESSGKHVLITDHGYTPMYDHSAKNGQYCVQFIIFTRGKSEIVRRWWAERCLEWCHAYIEDGKFGDQKYLDEWPKLFSDYVHILNHPEWTLAPWNADRFPYGNGIFFHFHGLRLIDNGYVNLGDYPLPKVLIRNLYIPYIDCLKSVIEDLYVINYKIKYQQKRTTIYKSINYILSFIRLHISNILLRYIKWRS